MIDTAHARIIAATIGALIFIVFGLTRLQSSEAGLDRVDTTVDGTPVTVLAPSDVPSAPVVVVAHGFAGCRQLMMAASVTLAQSGYIAVAFDFPGHGAHPHPLGGSLGSAARMASLRASLQSVVTYARSLEGGDGRVALLGHSMAGDVLVRHALDDPDISAIVGLSPYLSAPPPADAFEAPLLVAYGGWEDDFLKDMGRQAVAPVVADVGPTEIVPGKTYGAPNARRRLAIIDGAEHIGILFAPAALEQAVDWFDAAFGRDRASTVPVQPRRAGLGAWYLGVLLLAFVVVRWLPSVSDRPMGADLRGARFVFAAGLPAVVIPVVLAPVPTDFLPSILTDYLAVHLGAYGLLTATLLWALGAKVGDLGRVFRPRAFAVALAATLLFELVFVGLATDRFLSAFFPGPNRVAATVAAFFGAAVWFIADEWLTLGPNAPRGAYVATKALFLGSLILAVVLNPGELFFLILIVPAILALFVVYGSLSAWISRRTGSPLVAALAHALAFALAISATFPVVARHPSENSSR